MLDYGNDDDDDLNVNSYIDSRNQRVDKVCVINLLKLQQNVHQNEASVSCHVAGSCSMYTRIWWQH